MRTFLPVAVLLALGACDSMGLGKQSRRHLDITFVNRCATAVEVCYASNACVSLTDAKPREVRAQKAGESVFLTLKGTERSTTADETFSRIEIDESCQRFERKLGTAKESTAATAGGPSAF